MSTPEPYDSFDDTRDHIHRVQALLEVCAFDLVDRGRKHDASRLREPEKSAYDKFTPLLKEHAYGSPEYRATLKDHPEFKAAIAHHYAANRHHPEHFPNGVDGMTLLDVLEMLVDWKAASERHATGDFRHSLQHNLARFGLSLQLFHVLENTALELGWIEAGPTQAPAQAAEAPAAPQTATPAG